MVVDVVLVKIPGNDDVYNYDTDGHIVSRGAALAIGAQQGSTDQLTTPCSRPFVDVDNDDDRDLMMLAHFLLHIQSFPSSTVFKCEDYAKNDHVHRQWPIPPPDSATLPKLTGGGKYVWESFLAFQT